jgi:tetratricopeptide (TPR) repeat protein
MKKLILSIALVSAATLAFGQKKVVREAEKGFKSGDLTTALSAINAAATNPETSGDPATFLLKAQIQTKMFGADSSNTMETLEIGNNALSTFGKAFDMAGKDQSSATGKAVYADELPGIPDNLRPYSVNTLKNLSFDKAIDRYNEEDLEMAYEFFNLAGEIDKTDSTIHYNAGFLANDLGRFEDAKKHFNYLIALPDYNKLNAYYFMVQILSTEEQNPEGAYNLVAKAREQYPDDKVLAEYEIQLLLQLNRMDQAMAQIKEALANDPNNPGLWLRSGYLKEQSGDIEGGLADYKKSVEIDPEFYQGNYYTGALLLEMSTKMLNSLNDLSDAEWEKQSPIVGAKADENYKEAAKYFTKASQLQPENTDVMIILYQVNTRLKNTAEAEKYNQKLIKLLGPNWMDN